MGRAIVREPSAFLIDEPLSNLDARLRVQKRAEIARIQPRHGDLPHCECVMFGPRQHTSTAKLMGK